MDNQEFRLALTYRLIYQLGDAGKIQLQKMVYFMQEAFGVPTKYSFKMYHYGPYSEELDTDTSLLKLIGSVSVDRDAGGYGFHITPNGEPAEGWESATDAYDDKINKAIEVLGNKPATQLELLASIHFVNRLIDESTQAQVINIVHGLKPKFDEETIGLHYDELKKVGLL